MIGRTTQGRSFKGVAQYVLHDKGAKTSDRVSFIETLNLPTDDARKATAHMIDTAANSQALKTASGMKAGRKLEKPVYHYTLAWHPSETPTQAEQIEAARSSLEALGVADRQALIVAHTDTKHPHVHVIVNRVCPETGRAASMSNDRVKLSRWAEAYEKERGHVFCEARVENNNARDQGQWKKDQSLSRSAWMAWNKAETKSLWDQYRADRDAARADRKGQYQALWDQRNNRLSTRRAEVKELYKPKWRELYQRQREALKRYDERLDVRLRHAVRTKGFSVINMFRAMVNDKAKRQEFLDAQAKERQAVALGQRSAIADASREVTKAWKFDRDALKTLHRDQDAQRLAEAKERAAQLKEAQQKARAEQLRKDTENAMRQRSSQRTEQQKAHEAQHDFDQTAERRKSENQVKRSSLDAFYGEDREALENTKARKARRQERKAKERSRNRSRGKGRTRDR